MVSGRHEGFGFEVRYERRAAPSIGAKIATGGNRPPRSKDLGHPPASEVRLSGRTIHLRHMPTISRSREQGHELRVRPRVPLCFYAKALNKRVELPKIRAQRDAGCVEFRRLSDQSRERRF